MTNYAFLDTNVELSLLMLSDNSVVVNQLKKYNFSKLVLLSTIIQELTQIIKVELGNPQANKLLSKYFETSYESNNCYQYFDIQIDDYLAAGKLLEFYTGPVEFVNKYDCYGHIIKTISGKDRMYLNYRGISYFKTLCIAQLKRIQKELDKSGDKLFCFSTSEEFVSIASNNYLNAGLIHIA